MLKNYFVVAWRNFLKKKGLSLINILGISFGISFALLAFLFIEDELSFDGFHKNKNSIYRVDIYRVRAEKPDFTSRSVSAPIPLSPALREAISSVKYSTRFNNNSDYVRIGKTQFLEDICYVDSDFLKMFTIEFISGNSTSSLNNLNDILISTAKAVKFFGTEDAVGKIIELNKKTYTVSGVFKPFPLNSSLEGEIFLRYENTKSFAGQHDNWDSFYCSVFAQLNDGLDPATLESQLESFSKKHFGDNPKFREGLTLTPLAQIHFDNQVPWHKVSNKKYSYILGSAAVVILLVACINYILISLSGSLSRAREIGVRKVIGATRKMIRFQFWSESLITIGASVPLSLLILQLVLPEFNGLMNREIVSWHGNSNNWLLFLFGIIMLSGLLAGGYPALVLSKLVPEKILKGNGNGNHKTAFSGALIVFQFTVCFILLICAYVMFNQMKMVQTKDLGFNKDQIMVINTDNNIGLKGKRILDGFRADLANERNILSLSGMGSNFGSVGAVYVKRDSTGKAKIESYCDVDYDFFEMLELKLKDGRFFSRDFPSDTIDRFVINESLAKQIGAKPIIGASLSLRKNTEIIGVVNDFNFESLENPVQPIAFSLGKFYEKIFVKISPDNIPESINRIEKSWKKIVGDGNLEFTFLDDHINKQYKRYTQWTRVISISAFIAVAIACLGLMGIINLVIINRTKEIGIRKVLGATIASIFIQFSKNYVRLIFTGFVVAAPFAYYISTTWLKNFAYKTTVSWSFYLFPLVLIIGIALLVLGSQIVKTARANPVDSIRYE